MMHLHRAHGSSTVWTGPVRLTGTHIRPAVIDKRLQSELLAGVSKVWTENTSLLSLEHATLGFVSKWP